MFKVLGRNITTTQLVQHSLVVVMTLWLLQFASFYYFGPDNIENIKMPGSHKEDILICMEDKVNSTDICRPQCTKGYYSLPGMTHCAPCLSCSEIEKEVKILEPIAGGAVKLVYKAKLRGRIVAYNVLRKEEYREDFQHGLMMLRDLQPSRHIIQLIGFCDDVFVTEYHPLGTALSVKELLSGPLVRFDSISTRFELCISYVKVIDFLHTSPIGTRVMCDSNDIEKTLSQFLLNPDLSLVANDIDALPEVKDPEKIKCGHRELFGAFVAPEQLWPFENSHFVDELMPGYNEKTDIWKIPDVCNHFLGNSNDASLVHFHLYQVHKQCKEIDPRNRPHARDILSIYEEVKDTLGL